MKYLRQLLRQPLKLISGIIVVSLAVSILCVCLGQSIAADKTESSLEYNFTTVALPTTKYQYVEKEFNGIPYTAFSESLPEEVVNWIEQTVSNHPELVETVAAPGLASAYIPELIPDNVTQHKYHYPYTGTQESWAPHRLEATPAYACAMLEIVLDEIGEPYESVVEGVLEDGTPTTVTTKVEVTLTGTVKSVVSLEEGYDDPTGRTVYLTLVLPDMETLHGLALEVGDSYLVYGSDYLDGNWALRGFISDGLSAAMGNSVEIDELDENAFYYFTQDELDALAEINPYSTVVAQYWCEDEFTEIPAEMMRWKDAVMLTLEDKSMFGVYERVDYTDGSGSYPNINWGRWITDENGNLVQITQEEYSNLYSVPTIVHIEGSVEDFLQSENGQNWASQLELTAVNYQVFPVIGVEKLGYVADFARETARIVEGRDFTQDELTSGAKVCILSETLAAANGLSVGDTISPHFYDYDWDSPNQAFISAGKGVVNPSAYTYTANTEFVGNGEDYVIVGLYRQDNAWGDVSENLYSFTPNTIFVPKTSVSSDMDYGNQGFFQTLVLKNGTIEGFRTIVNEAGYEDLFVYYDQGYTTISESLHNYKEVAQRAMMNWVTSITRMRWTSTMICSNARPLRCKTALPPTAFVP